jgi:hypothetical protein
MRFRSKIAEAGSEIIGLAWLLSTPRKNFRRVGYVVERLWLLRSAAVVNFHQANASAVVQSREQRGVKPRRKCRGDARL